MPVFLEGELRFTFKQSYLISLNSLFNVISNQRHEIMNYVLQESRLREEVFPTSE